MGTPFPGQPSFFASRETLGSSFGFPRLEYSRADVQKYSPITCPFFLEDSLVPDPLPAYANCGQMLEARKTRSRSAAAGSRAAAGTGFGAELHCSRFSSCPSASMANSCSVRLSRTPARSIQLSTAPATPPPPRPYRLLEIGYSPSANFLTATVAHRLNRATCGNERTKQFSDRNKIEVLHIHATSRLLYAGPLTLPDERRCTASSSLARASAASNHVDTARRPLFQFSRLLIQFLFASSTRGSTSRMAWFFVFFFISGFCSVLYELIWLRLAMAEFGVTTALVSIVLSMFMAGLGAGSWIAGRALRRYEGRVQFPPLRLYAFTELLIGISALVVPLELHWGNRLIEALASHAPLSSAAFYLIAGGWVALTLIPWCACMGATSPVAMFAIKKDSRLESRRSFSFLYLSNVLGAVAGAILPLFLNELDGFHRTLRVGAVCNAIIFISALSLTLVSRPRSASASAAAPAIETRASLPPAGSGGILRLLFLTGLVTMGMEVIWIRIFTPYIGPVVYSFAMVLVAYLLATFVGSQIYRFWSRTHTIESRLLWISLAVLGVLPLLTADARVPLHLVLRVFLGVAPFAGVIGFLTPMLVDRWSAGDPDRAGRAYAVNVVGCILGPLVSGFILLPWGGEHFAMLMFTLPWIATALSPQALLKATLDARAPSKLTGYAWVAAALAIFCFTKDYETQFARRVVLRDATATVIATGEGMHKQLLINGIGMTSLTPVTKMMAHLTLSSLPHPPQNALIICFGMGTTFRSVLSWGIPATVVELVPSVPRLFWYYHP